MRNSGGSRKMQLELLLIIIYNLLLNILHTFFHRTFGELLIDTTRPRKIVGKS